MFDVIVKIIELVFLLIGLILIVFGWIIPHKQEQKRTERQREYEQRILQRQRDLELINKQISQLYAPIASIFKEQKILFNTVLKQLNRNYIILEKQKFADLPERERKIIQHYTEEYQIPYFKQITTILTENYHLLYNSKIPSSYNKFLEYAIAWEFLNSQYKNGLNNDYNFLSLDNFPIKFSEYIYNTLSLLNNKRDKFENDVIILGENINVNEE